MNLVDVDSLPAEPLSALRELFCVGIELEALLREQVAEARSQGATWEEIGESLGMSRQSAWEYYTRDVRQILDRAAANGEELSEEEALRMATEQVAQIRRRRRRGRP